jgi:hypothetical protein
VEFRRHREIRDKIEILSYLIRERERERERERHGALETLAPGPPAGVLNSGLMGVNQRKSSECVPRAVSLAC